MLTWLAFLVSVAAVALLAAALFVAFWLGVSLLLLTPILALTTFAAATAWFWSVLLLWSFRRLRAWGTGSGASGGKVAGPTATATHSSDVKPANGGVNT